VVVAAAAAEFVSTFVVVRIFQETCTNDEGNNLGNPGSSNESNGIETCKLRI